jgi:hypothetical protein
MKPKIKKNGHTDYEQLNADLLGSAKHKKPKLSSNMITSLARKNVGGRRNFKNIAAYRLAVAQERERIVRDEKLTNKELMEAVGSALSTGTPVSYRPEFAEVARLVCSLYGSTSAELSKFFKVSVVQISEWIRDYPEFDRAVHDRSTELNIQVMGRLARRALGFYAKTEKIFYDVKRGGVVKVDTKEYYPPSESAIFFWLKNRMPEHWKDVKDVNIDESRKVVLEIYKNFDTMTQEQATDAYQELLKVEGGGVQLPAPSEAKGAAQAPRNPRKGSITDVSTDD